MSNLAPGQLVRSCQGRDRGQWMIIMKVLDNDYALLCDGKIRKIEKPKKKKLKHISKTNIIFDDLQNKITQNIISNADIRKKIADYCSANTREEC
ncbi:MAG: hypothetical protein GYA50_07725 [Eubacteriaceae bacterium]|nr:hypothetical protein [Eubacteriaceae bacterium]